MTGPTHGTTTGTSAGPGRTVNPDREARRWNSRTAEVDAAAWTIVHSGIAPGGLLDDDGSGAGEDDGPEPAAVPDLGMDDDDDGPGPSDPPAEPDLRRRPAVRPAITFSRTVTGALEFEVPALVSDDPEVTARLEQLRVQLVRLGEQLLVLQPAAIAAPDLASAHAALVPLTKAALSGAVGLETRTGSFASRHRGMFLRICAGAVPLDFFTWRPEPTTERVLLVVAELLSRGCSIPEAARRAARRCGAKPDTVRRWTRRVAALLDAPEVVGRARARWPEDVTAEVVGELFPGDRGEAAVRMALVGRIGPPARPLPGRPRAGNGTARGPGVGDDVLTRRNA